jgi:hypothetical protein
VKADAAAGHETIVEVLQLVVAAGERAVNKKTLIEVAVVANAALERICGRGIHVGIGGID